MNQAASQPPRRRRPREIKFSFLLWECVKENATVSGVSAAEYVRRCVQFMLQFGDAPSYVPLTVDGAPPTEEEVFMRQPREILFPVYLWGRVKAQAENQDIYAAAYVRRSVHFHERFSNVPGGPGGAPQIAGIGS